MSIEQPVAEKTQHDESVRAELKARLMFGSGSFLRPLWLSGLYDEFEKLDARDQARLAGWVDSCPVVEELTDPENTAPGRGPEAMLERYGEVNYWFRYIEDELERENNNVYLELSNPVPRRAGEPVGKHEPESVPLNHADIISPMGALAGFALPRLLLKQFGPKDEKTGRYNDERFMKGLRRLDAAISEADSAAELLALTAEGLSFADVDPLTVLANTLPTGWMGEHNATSMLNAAKDALRRKAPALWEYYVQLTDGQKAAAKIA